MTRFVDEGEEALSMEKSNERSQRVTRLSAQTARKVLNDTSARPRQIPAEDVVGAFGGKHLDIAAGDTKDPLTLLAIRDFLESKLRSTGGRPGLSGETARQKVQVSARDWRAISDIAGRIKVNGYRPSPAQVAGVLIHLALEQVDAAEIRRSIEVEP